MTKKRSIRKFVRLFFATLLILLTMYMISANRQITQQENIETTEIAPGRFYTIDDFRIHVRMIDNRAEPDDEIPVLMLHGFGPAGSAVWASFAESQIAAQRIVILPDFLGMGYSERVLQPGSHYTIAGQARMIAALLDELGIQQVDLLGHSYGGAVSAQFALDYPEKVRRVVLLDAQIYENRLGDFFRSLGSLPLGIGRAVTWSSLGGGSTLYTSFCEETARCEIQQVVLIRGTVDALQAISDTTQVTRLPGDLDKFTVPVAVIWGGADHIVAIEDGQRLAEALGVQLDVIEGASHTPFLDKPEETALRILEFFSMR